MRRLVRIAVQVIGIVVLALLAAVTALTWTGAARGTDCPADGPDMKASEVLSHEAFPPKVICRYEYWYEAEPSVKTYDATLAMVVSFVATAGAVYLAIRLSRTLRDRSRAATEGS